MSGLVASIWRVLSVLFASLLPFDSVRYSVHYRSVVQHERGLRRAVRGLRNILQGVSKRRFATSMLRIGRATGRTSIIDLLS